MPMDKRGWRRVPGYGHLGNRVSFGGYNQALGAGEIRGSYLNACVGSAPPFPWDWRRLSRVSRADPRCGA